MSMVVVTEKPPTEQAPHQLIQTALTVQLEIGAVRVLQRPVYAKMKATYAKPALLRDNGALLALTSPVRPPMLLTLLHANLVTQEATVQVLECAPASMDIPVWLISSSAIQQSPDISPMA